MGGTGAVEEEGGRLPEGLSGLLRVGIDDVGRCERDGRYRVDMLAWHRPVRSPEAGEEALCEVCAAGAVMAKSLALPPAWGANAYAKGVGPDLECVEDWGEEVTRKLLALDRLRRGEVLEALREMHEEVPEALEVRAQGMDREIASYEEDAGRWRRDLEGLHRALVSAGL